MRKTLTILLILCGFAAGAGATDMAGRAYRAGLKAERAGDHMKALFLYAQAAQANTKNRRYSRKLAAALHSAALVPRVDTGRDPADESTVAHLEQQGLIDDPSLNLKEAAPPPRLVASEETHSFTLRGDARAAFEKVAAAYGIRLLFEPDYRAPAPLKLDISEEGYREALRQLEAATDSFVVPLSAGTALVARDTVQNRTQWTPEGAIAVPIPERITVQEGQEIATAVQQTLEIRRISLDPGKRVVYFRDTVSKVYAAQAMFRNLARLRGQVTVDVEFMSASKTSSLSYGLTLPTSASIIDFGSLPKILAASIPAGSPGFAAALSIAGTQLGVGIGNSVVIAALARSNVTSLLDSSVTALDGQAVTLKVGSRYPVTTASYSAPNGTAVSGGGTIPTINYVDLGLSLKITPALHDDGEVSLDIEAEYKSLGAGGANGIPAINDQQFQGKVRLTDGQWAVVAGLVQTTRNNNTTGIWGLSRIPILGALFSTRTKEDDHNEVLLVLKPHLVAKPAWDEAASRPIWTGSETRPLTVF
jgi:general secretion pathway protein D